ncbi:hypothetical protein BGW80DRAFT_143245 [Lactifluus volemus]|nr:hypothetical protein BGW80DRAFT_143245 [Lactifluus volemus]
MVSVLFYLQSNVTLTALLLYACLFWTSVSLPSASHDCHGTWVFLSSWCTVSFRHRQPQKLLIFLLGLFDGPPTICSHLLARPQAGPLAGCRTTRTLTTPPSTRLEDESREWIDKLASLIVVVPLALGA